MTSAKETIIRNFKNVPKFGKKSIHLQQQHKWSVGTREAKTFAESIKDDEMQDKKFIKTRNDVEK